MILPDKTPGVSAATVVTSGTSNAANSAQADIFSQSAATICFANSVRLI
jgi:hypothetical protein